MVAFFCCNYVYSTSCLGWSHVIDLSVKLGSLTTVINRSRSTPGVGEPYYQDRVSFLPTQRSAQCWLLLRSLKTSSTYNVYRKYAAKLDLQITQVSPGDIFPFYFHSLSIGYRGEVCAVPVTDWSKVGCKRPCRCAVVCLVVDWCRLVVWPGQSSHLSTTPDLHWDLSVVLTVEIHSAVHFHWHVAPPPRPLLASVFIFNQVLFCFFFQSPF